MLQQFFQEVRFRLANTLWALRSPAECGAQLWAQGRGRHWYPPVEREMRRWQSDYEDYVLRSSIEETAEAGLPPW